MVKVSLKGRGRGRYFTRLQEGKKHVDNDDQRWKVFYGIAFSSMANWQTRTHAYQDTGPGHGAATERCYLYYLFEYHPKFTQGSSRHPGRGMPSSKLLPWRSTFVGCTRPAKQSFNAGLKVWIYNLHFMMGSNTLIATYRNPL